MSAIFEGNKEDDKWYKCISRDVALIMRGRLWENNAVQMIGL